jgi:hypothetical protein
MTRSVLSAPLRRHSLGGGLRGLRPAGLGRARILNRGCNAIPRRARPGLFGLRPHKALPHKALPLPDIEQWSQSSGPDVIPRRDRPGLAGQRPHKAPPLPHIEQWSQSSGSNVIPRRDLPFRGGIVLTYLAQGLTGVHAWRQAVSIMQASLQGNLAHKKPPLRRTLR